MNIDDIKNIWQEDMNQLERRVRVNEEKVKNLTFNKAKNTFDILLKISILGKNLALVYTMISLGLIYFVWESPAYIVMLVTASGLMLFSFFQHRLLKKIDYASLSILELQKEINKFRIHTARTAIFDVIIVIIWLIVMGLSFSKVYKGWDVFVQPEEIGGIGTRLVIYTVLIIVFSKFTYKIYNKKLKESENNLRAIEDYETN